MVLETQFLANIFYNPELLDKITLTGDEFINAPVKIVFKKIREIHNKEQEVTKDVLPVIYELNKDIFEQFEMSNYKDLEKHIFHNYEKIDWLYTENVIKEKYKKRLYQKVFEEAQLNIEKKPIDNVLNNLDIALSQLDKEDIKDNKLIQSTDFKDIYEERTKEIKELKKTGKLPYYSLYHPVLKQYVRMKRGWSWNIIAKTGAGKTIVATDLLLQFVKEYNERALFITDENSDEVILTYLHCSYFNIKYKDVEDRKIDISKLIDNLDEKGKKEYDRVFSNIDVIELPSIPISQVKKILKRAKNNSKPYTYVFIDSFDEINTDMKVEEVTRYDLNAKELERLPKEFDCLVGVSNQLATVYYNTSIDKIPKLCTHQSKTIMKKVSLSLLIGEEMKKDKDGENEFLGHRIKINKCRSGGDSVIYGITRNFDYCKIIPSDSEIGNGSSSNDGIKF